MSSVSFVSGNRSIGLNQFHLEWCPKYRKHILVDAVKTAVEQSIIRTAQIHKIIIHNMHVGAEHIHLFVSLPFNMSISEAFRLLKGRSAKEIFDAFPDLRENLKKGHLWSPGKFCRSISNVKASTIRNYIVNHRFKELNHSIHEARTEAEQMRLQSFI